MFLMETFTTFIFISVVLMIKYTSLGRQDDQNHLLNSLTMGFTLSVMTAVGQEVSGGCLNPVIGLVQMVFQNIITSSYPSLFNTDSSKNLGY